MAELNATTGGFVKDIKVSSIGLRQVNALTSDSTHVWAVDSDANAVAELNAGSGSLVKVLKGKAYRFDGPLAISTDGAHVWVANDRTNSLTELTAKTGAFVRFVHGKKYGLSVVTAIASNGTDVWVTNLGATATTVGGVVTGNTVSEFNVSSGSLVQVLRGARYGFNQPNAITYIGGRVWVANDGSNSMTEFSAG